MAPLEICRKRGVVAVLASGMVISLTALTGGVAPAFAKPDDDRGPGGPSPTLIYPEPEYSAPEPEQAPAVEEPKPEAPKQEAPKQEAPKQAPLPEPVAPQPEPVAPAPEPVVEAPAPPKVQAPTQTQAPEPVAEPEPVRQAPQPTRPPATAVAPEAPSEEAPARPSADEPATAPEPPAAPREVAPSDAAPSAEEPSPARRAGDADPDVPSSNADTPESSGTPVAPSEALAPPSEDKDASRDRDTRTGGSESESTSEATSEAEDSTASSEVSQAARAIETAQPETLVADQQDIEVAKTAKVIEEKPQPAVDKDVDGFASSINLSLGLGGRDVINAGADADFRIGDRDRDRDWDWARKVRQWRPDWVSYDDFYRPILMNPFRAPVRIVYLYDFAPRIVYIPPLARIVLDVARYAAYSFTALVLNPINSAIDLAQDVVQTAADVAIGSFFGGGYIPRVGLPLPPPPPPVLRYDNVPVLVRYPQQTYEPFRVRRIVDVGDDAQYGGRKVLLDGVTPAWGQWTQTASGERQFEIHKTQQFPGLDTPAAGPLPGDYPLRLAADESSTGGLTGRDVFLYVAAGVVGTLGFAAVAGAFLLGRRRPQH